MGQGESTGAQPHKGNEDVDDGHGDEEEVQRILLLEVALERAQRRHGEHPHAPHAHQPRDVGLVRGVGGW